MNRRSVWLSLGVLGILCAAPAALATGAAPTYVTSDPQNGATVQEGPSRVSVTFSEPLEASSTLQVFDECGRAIDADDEQVLGSRIDVGLALIPSGKYTAVYAARGFAGATGETKGSFSFDVTSGVPCGGEQEHHHHGGGDGDGDGGHDGHGGGSGHSGHGDGGNHSGGGLGHTTHGSGHTTHDGSGHTDGAAHGGSGHDGHGGGGHGGTAHHDGHGGEHSGNRGSNGGGGIDELASGRGGLGLAPTSTSVVIALTLSIAMGALGGWVLRVSAGS